ncbi:hypothetical protein AUK40_03665, partial [Candidatus Wirthbacteria bacterium CG2_30_54_11]
MEIVNVFVSLFIFPGLLSLITLALFADWLDRKLYARMQARVGPQYTGPHGLLQPFADLIKLLAKEDITPKQASSFMFNILPLVAFAAVGSAATLLPIGRLTVYNSFPGDILVILYLLGLPTLVYFLAGWHSSSFFGVFGGVRAITQLFAYEVPFLIAILSPAILTGSWQLSEIANHSLVHPLHMVVYIFGLIVAVIGLQAKLERMPFDVPEAETEIVGGPFTEYSGKKLALVLLARQMALVVGSALIATVFLGGFGLGWMSPVWFLLKTGAVILVLVFIRAGTARLRIDQVIDFSCETPHRPGHRFFL